MLRVATGKDRRGIHSIVWVWLISYMIKTFTHGNNMINYKGRSRYYNTGKVPGRWRREQSLQERKHRIHSIWLWIITTVASISRQTIVSVARITHDVETIADLTVGRTPTSEGFKVGNAPQIDQAKLKSQSLGRPKILKIKWNLQGNILHLDHQYAWRLQLLKTQHLKIHSALSI